MEQIFKVKDNSVQEFIDKYVIHSVVGRDPRDTRNPYYVFGKSEVIVKDDLIKDYNLTLYKDLQDQI